MYLINITFLICDLFRRWHKTLPQMSSSDCQNGRWKLQSYDLCSLWRWVLLALYERNQRSSLS